MSAATLLAALLAMLESAGVLSNVAVTILTAAGESGEAVTILKAVSSVLSQSTTINKAITNIVTDIQSWCDGDTTVSVADLMVACDTIKSQSAEIQAIS